MSDDVLHLARIASDKETLELLARLADEARAGDLVGAIVVPLYTRRARNKFRLCLTGWAAQNPTYALGAFTACQVLLQEHALEFAGLL